MRASPVRLLGAYLPLLFVLLPSTELRLASAHEGHDREFEYPTIVEIDLIFPQHNATYKRTQAMPIVFAIQNFTAVNNFSYFFQWHLKDLKRKQAVIGSLNHNIFNTTPGAVVPEPFLIVNHTGNALLDRDADPRWILGYEFGYLASCNATKDGQLQGRVGPPITLLEGIIPFSVADNGTEPNLAAAGPCAGALGNFDVLGHVNGTPPPWDCPVLPEDASTTVTFGTLDKPEEGYIEEDIDPVNPCGVRVTPELVKNVTDTLLRERCVQTNNHTGECAAVNAASRTGQHGRDAVVVALTAAMAVGVGFFVIP